MKVIGLIGSSECTEELADVATRVGESIAERGDILICGGLGGVMEAACRGARERGGITVGILPGDDSQSANEYVSIPVVTGIGHARNIIIVRSSSGVIAVGGRFGTLSEIAYACTLGIPVVGIATWEVGAPLVKAASAEEAVETLYRLM